MQVEQTKSLEDAIHHLQSLPPTLREEVFHYIDFLIMRNVHKEQMQTAIKKRHFGICKDKGSFVIKDDFEMTEDEFVETKTVKRHAGTLKGEVIFSDDFDEPLEDFKDYL